MEELRANLLSAQSQLEQSAVLSHELGTVKAQIEDAGFDIHTLPALSLTPAASPAPLIGASPSAQLQAVTPFSGRSSPSQISPFQSVSTELPLSTAIEALQDTAAADDSSPAVEAASDHQTAHEDTVKQSSLVASLQQENTALKSQLDQLSQREAAEEADVTSLQAQNKGLIADLDKLRGQLGEVWLFQYAVFAFHIQQQCVWIGERGAEEGIA